MAITVSCECGKSFTTKDEYAGRQANCPACKRPLTIPTISSLEAPAEPAAAPPPPPPPPPLAPLGREPAAASYGLLSAVAWGFLIVGLIFSGWQVYKTLNPVDPNTFFGQGGFRPTPGMRLPVPGPVSVSALLLPLLGLAQNILAGLTMVWLVNSMTRLDKYANWIVWRSEGLSKPIGEPLGSSLPYILPWTVPGGLLVILGVGVQPEGASSIVLGQMPGGKFAMVAAGALLFLTGLGCGEIRRFFWRMAQAGHAIPRRKRGGEISIGPPARVGGGDTYTHSPVFMLLALGALVCGYGIVALQMLPVIFSDPTSLALFVTVTLGILGGGYTLYLLGGLWGDLVQSWNRAANSVALVQRPHFGALGTRGFSACALAMGVAILLLDAYLLIKLLDEARSMRSGDGMFTAVVATVCLPASAVLFMWWLGALKKDCHQFVKATSVVPHSYEEVAQSGGLRIAALSLLGVLGVQVAIVLYHVFQLLSSPVFGRAEMVVGALFGILIGLGLGVLPVYWLALVAMDMDRAAGNLQACHEVRN